MAGKTTKKRKVKKMPEESGKNDNNIGVILQYAKNRAETLGGLVDYYREKEVVEGFSTTTDRFIYGMSMAQMQEIDKLISFIEELFPQGNILDTFTNNEKEENENMLFENLNLTSRTLREGIELSMLEFKPLKEFIGQDIVVDGFFFTEGKYGKQVVVVGNNAKINLPSRYVEKFEQIESNAEMLKGVMDGKLVLTNVRSIATNNGNTTTFLFTTKE